MMAASASAECRSIYCAGNLTPLRSPAVTPQEVSISMDAPSAPDPQLVRTSRLWFAKDGEKIYSTYGPAAWFVRWHIVPPVAFHGGDMQPEGGGRDVSRGDVLSGPPF